MRGLKNFLLLAFNPFAWPMLIQGLRKAEGQGFMSAMFPLAILGTIGFGSGLTSSIPWVGWALTIWGLPWLVISTIAAVLVVYDSIRTMAKEGLRGFRLARQWFEMGRMTFLVAVILSVITATGSYFDTSMFEFTGFPILFFILTFMLASTTGYAVANFRRQHISGQLREFVDFFFPLIFASVAIILPAALLANYFDPLAVIYTTVAIALVGISVVGLRKYWRELKELSP